MSKVSILAKTLKNINRVSKKILKDAVPIAEDLAGDDSELVEEFLERYNVTEEVAGGILQQTLLLFIEDAERIENEFLIFSDVVCEGDDAIAEVEGCDFFQELWFGDIYDVARNKALTQFLKDLQATSQKINDDSIIVEAGKRLPQPSETVTVVESEVSVESEESEPEGEVQVQDE